MDKVLSPTQNHLIGQKKQPSKGKFFDDNGHLNDAGMTLYVEARLLEREEELPTSLLEHVEACTACQHEIFELYQLMQEEDVSDLSPHPYLDRPKPFSTWVNLWQFTSSASRVAAVILMAVASCLGYLLVNQPNINNSQAVVSPFKNPAIDTPYQEWKIDASKGHSLSLENGSYLHIPASIFVDEKGNTVQGMVNIRYREFHKAAQIIASGMPLGIKQGNHLQATENAGAFEVRGEQQGKPIYIAAGKYIAVNIISEFTDEDFGNYYLNEDIKKQYAAHTPFVSTAYANSSLQPEWIYQQKSKIFYSTNQAELRKLKLAAYKKTLDSLGKEIQNTQAQVSYQMEGRRQRFQNDPIHIQPFFSLLFDTKENPTLSEAQAKIWKYVGEDKGQSPTYENRWVLNEKWDNLKLTLQKYKALTLKGHTNKVNDAQFSRDGKYIITASSDHTAKVWSDKAQYLYTLKGHTAGVNTAVFSPKHNPDNGYILTASNDRTAKIWSFKGGDCITTLTGHSNAVIAARYSNDGEYILTTSADNTARLWNSKGQQKQILPHLKETGEAQISDNSKWIATISSDSTAHIWDIKSEKSTQINGRFSRIQFLNKGDKSLILTVDANSRSGNAKLWTLNGKKKKEFSFNDKDVVFSPDNQHIVTVKGENARLWFLNPADSYNTVLIRNMFNLDHDDRNAHLNFITNIDYVKKDGEELILTSSNDHSAKIWSSNGRVLHTLREHTDKINKTVYSPTEDKILTASDDYTAKLWVEREIKDVFEMQLEKKEKQLIGDKGEPILIQGKKFYTLVKEANTNEISDDLQIVSEPSFNENPLNQLIERYKEVSEKIRTLELQQIPNIQLLMRAFTVPKFGYYAAQRPYTASESIAVESSFSFEKGVEAHKVKLYHITGERETVIVPIPYQPEGLVKMYFRLYMPNKILAIFPNDRVAMSGRTSFTKLSEGQTKNQQHFNFELLPSFALKNMNDFQTFLEEYQQ